MQAALDEAVGYIYGMRFLIVLVLLCFIAVGVVLGALNADLVSYDFGFTNLQLPKGAALLLALGIGWLLGGMTAWLGTSIRHRRVSRGQRSRDDTATRTAAGA